ncbi:MAG TPA: SusD/RagB family nutrient-binding outer membrane lipoprotein [Puia sp.]|nr:SusD/RagB family nutrient-binding outer membrane lipoprotein [Puia sp.]
MRNLSIISCLFAGCLASSCTKNIQNLNIDSKHAVSVPATSLFLAGEKNLSDNYTTTSISVMPFRVFAQGWTETTYTTEARYILSAYNSPDNLWAALYSSILNNLTDAKTAFPASVSDPGTLRNDLIITDILEVYSYNILVATYGNIPYTQAENRNIPYPKYDDAKTVYYDLLTRLDTCIAGLNTASPAMGAADQIYKGNITAWKKFAATMKLKMAMLLADSDPSTAGKKVQEAVATGVFASNNDNAKIAYQSSPTGNTNPIWQAVINSGRHDFCPAGLLVNNMNSWNDPRLPLYWITAPDNTYKGGIAGASNSAPLLSTFSAQWTAATYPSDLLDYAETEFLLAEAVERGFLTGGNTAEQYYDAGVTASITFWGGTTAQANTYLAQPSVAYSTAAGGYKQKIGYQKWIAEVNRGWDAWTDIRRLGQPAIDAISPPVGAITTMPIRFYYPLKEQTANPTNWAAAAKLIPGGDLVTSKLFWMP